MKPAELRRDLLVHRTELIKQLDALSAQLQACDAMLASLPADTAVALPPLPALASDPPAATPTPLPAAPSVPAPFPAPSPAPTPASAEPPDDFGFGPDGTFRGIKWGRIASRLSRLIAESPETFSVETIREAYKARHHWTGYPTESSIASSFLRVVRKEGYRVLRPGRGRTPALYTKQKLPPTPVTAAATTANALPPTSPANLPSATPPRPPGP